MKSQKIKPQFPLYIPSKGRWESRHTVKALEAMGVPFSIVVEEQEYNNYAQVIDKKKILVLDPAYKKNYDCCGNLGPTDQTGSGPARNFIWDHATALGFSYHWIMDDNIAGFCFLNDNEKVRAKDGAFFRYMENFCLRYSNIVMAGPQYGMFVPKKRKCYPFVLNTRIYSCNLIKNNAPFRWRARYNEDTDLSLRMLKAGYCTVLFNAFLQKKIATQKVKGGNTDSIYTCGTAAKTQMLKNLHPDVVEIKYKFHRWHHYINYKKHFSHNKLRQSNRNCDEKNYKFTITVKP